MTCALSEKVARWSRATSHAVKEKKNFVAIPACLPQQSRLSQGGFFWASMRTLSLSLHSYSNNHSRPQTHHALPSPSGFCQSSHSISQPFRTNVGAPFTRHFSRNSHFTGTEKSLLLSQWYSTWMHVSTRFSSGNFWPSRSFVKSVRRPRSC